VDTQRLKELQELLQTELAPIQKIKAGILNRSMPRIIVFEDGKIVHEYDKDTKAKIAEADRILKDIIEMFCRKHNLPVPG